MTGKAAAPGAGDVLRLGQAGEIRNGAQLHLNLHSADQTATPRSCYFSFVEQIRPGSGVVLDRMTKLNVGIIPVRVK